MKIKFKQQSVIERHSVPPSPSPLERAGVSLLLFILLTFAACSDDDQRGGGTARGGLEDVTFILSLSGGEATRALTEAEEEQADDIHVLGFVDENNDGTYTYTYRTKASAISRPATGKLQFTAGLRRYDFYKQRFVLLANCESYGNLPALDACQGVDDLDTFLPKLLVRSDAEWRAHNTAPTDPVDYIPMYALSTPITITQSTTSIDGDAAGLLLIRMLARLDVSVQNSVTNFRLVSAELFNRKNMGHIAYKQANWNATDQKVTVADMPASATGFATTKLPGVVYPADAMTHAVTRSVYTFETQGVATSKNDATAIVVGGYYDYPTNQADVTYYRIDIPEFDALGVEKPGTWGDILRNHLYNIRIKTVSQKGAKTSEDAFNGAAWVEASITPWNLADMDDVKFEGIYGLKASPAVFTAKQPGATSQKLTIFTDYDEGWEATLMPATASSWVQFAPGTVFSGGNGVESILTFDIAANLSPVVRHAVLKVRAGGMVKYVDIFQSNDIEGDIFDWTNSEQDSGSEFDGSYRLGVGWTRRALHKNAQTGIGLLISTDWTKGWTTSVTAPWITITANGTNTGVGSKTLTFSVDENNTKAPREGTIRVKAGNLIKEVTVKQSNVADASGNANVSPWDDSAHDAESELEAGTPYTLQLSRTECRYDGLAGGRFIYVTAGGGGNWTATSNASWLILITTSGVANGSQSVLNFYVDAYAAGADREGIITLKLGNVTKEIKITQYAGAGIEAPTHKDVTATGRDKFTIKTKCPWVAHVDSDPQGIIEQLRTPSGLANEAGSDFEFSIKKHVEGAMATMIISSVDYECPGRKVTVFIPYDLGGLYVYPVDQRVRESWYVYSNTPGIVNELSEPPFTGTQASPARTNSCAAISSLDSGKPWRLPTNDELNTVIQGSWGGNVANSVAAQASLESYGFAWGVYYWAATAYTYAGNDWGGSYAFIRSTHNATWLGQGKAYAESNNYFARCVRTK